MSYADSLSITPAHHAIGQAAEAKVLAALARLPEPWQFFSSVEWRALGSHGERIGEADVMVLHPHYGLVVIEIKAGAVYIKDGTWHYASGRPMKISPPAQARRNRFEMHDKLAARIGTDAVKQLTITDAVWLPDVQWKATLPAEFPDRAFLLDRLNIHQPEIALQKLLLAANPKPVAWTRAQLAAVQELFAPTVTLTVPLANHVDQTKQALRYATQQQIAILKILSTQSRLLVEGCAGSGKTILALTLAQAHAAQGKQVLFTCYNKHLAHYLTEYLQDQPNIHVYNFHRLVEVSAQRAGMPYVVPTDKDGQKHFFSEGCAELLMDAAQQERIQRFDTIIVDEAADFLGIWWLALESLGASDFRWYCFYDLNQSIYQAAKDWQPPFTADVMTLDHNLRNTQPIGTYAAEQTNRPMPSVFRVTEGVEPVRQTSADFTEMAQQLRQLLKQLIHHEAIRPEQIVLLSPYRHTNSTSTWAEGLRDVIINLDMATATAGQVRVGTIHGFKGLEADVVILVGLNQQAKQHPEWLYVGATRARASLFVLALLGAVDV